MVKAVFGVLIVSVLYIAKTHAQVPFWVFQESFTGNPGPSVGGAVKTTVSTYFTNLPTPDVVSTVASAAVHGTGNSELRIIPRVGNPGIGYVMGSTGNFNERYKARLIDNEDIVTWHVAMRHSRANETLSTSFAADRTASAVVLACDKADPTASDAKGYGLFLMRISSGTRTIILKYFDSGISNISNADENRILYSDDVADNSSDNRFRVKVTYDPSDGTWTLATTNTTSLGNPLTNTYTPRGSVVNTSGVNTTMPYYGFAHCWTDASGSSNSGIYDNFYVSVGEESTQPVKLSSFTAKANLQNIDLAWSTASEQDNSHFDVLRSGDGKTFTKMGEIKGKGTTNITQQYIFTDKNAVPGINYYQLKQVDNNGDFRLSEVVAVKSNVKTTHFNVMVNEEKSCVQLTVYTTNEGKANFTIYDLNGHKFVKKELVLSKGYTNISVPFNVDKGFYFASLAAGTEITTQKFIK